MATHLAAVSVEKGSSFELQSRPTPKPGPDELLIAVKSVALNPADSYMRDQGLLVSTYPTVLGFDMSGLVLEVGEKVPVDDSATDGGPVGGPVFNPGITRVAAYAASVWKSCNPNYGAFQERCLVPWQHAVPLPDGDQISWNQAATLPVAAEVPLNAWDIMGIPRVGEVAASPSTSAGGATLEDKKHKSEALLVWGASSSVGTMGVQSARLLREDHGSSFAAVYATAGAANHVYVASLGANRVFNYKEPGVVDAIVSAAREDGLVIRHCFLAVGELALCQAVLKAFTQDGKGGEDRKAKIASAPPVPADAKAVDGLETVFVMPSWDEAERLSQFRYWMGTWLREKLAGRTITPSPPLRVVGKGLGAINPAVDEISEGVSCTKLIVEIAE